MQKMVALDFRPKVAESLICEAGFPILIGSIVSQPTTGYFVSATIDGHPWAEQCGFRGSRPPVLRVTAAELKLVFAQMGVQGAVGFEAAFGRRRYPGVGPPIWPIFSILKED